MNILLKAAHFTWKLYKTGLILCKYFLLGLEDLLHNIRIQPLTSNFRCLKLAWSTSFTSGSTTAWTRPCGSCFRWKSYSTCSFPQGSWFRRWVHSLNSVNIIWLIFLQLKAQPINLLRKSVSCSSELISDFSSPHWNTGFTETICHMSPILVTMSPCPDIRGHRFVFTAFLDWLSELPYM